MKIFVYGTLKRGYGNNYHLEHAKFMGPAETVQRFALLDDGIPFMLLPQADHAYPVLGELYDIGNDRKTLASLDRLESEGSMYDRVTGYVLCNGKQWLASYYIKHGITRHYASRRLVQPVNGRQEWNR